jgi:glutathione S-transferase
MHLFYKPGACSMAAHIVLNEVGAEFTRESVDTAKGLTESGADYAAINPRGYVPALRLADGTVITENAAILQYLGDQFPRHALVPAAGGLERVRLQEALSFLTSELHKAFGPFFSGREMTGAERERAVAALGRRIGQFATMLDGGDYLVGARLTVADFLAFVILNWSNFIGVSLADWPVVEGYMARIAARPSVQQTLRAEGLAA